MLPFTFILSLFLKVSQNKKNDGDIPNKHGRRGVPYHLPTTRLL
jgi:hypothetical protein